MSLLTQFTEVKNKISKANEWAEHILLSRKHYELTYFIANGAQAITTDMIASADTMIDITFQYTTTSSADDRVFDTQNAVPYLLFGRSNSKFRYVDSDASGSHTAYATQNTSKHTLHLGVNFTLDSTTLATGVVYNNKKLYLCGNLGTNGGFYSTNLRIYEAKQTDINTNETLHWYVPVEKLDGTICLYDKILDKYLYNSGTGTFTAGARK